MSTINFNAEAVEPSVPFEAIPAGKYTAIITDSDLKETRSGTGRYLQLEFEITEGEYSGRKLWSRLNIENPNPDAVKFARADLAAICHAVNILHPADSVELHNLPLQITVRCKKNQDDEIVNEIKSYGPVPTATIPAVPVPQPGVVSAPPWVRN